ncbi:MAG: pyridoxal kinase [Hyphomicrobiaceae bacterium]|nr:pyridoxal kinase [Hyphomicrobiaceae bacterium]
MPRILAISSYVASGHVGLAAIVPALQALGHDVAAVPTIVLSRHPGHRASAGAPLAPDQFQALVDQIVESAADEPFAAIITGYMPSARHVEIAAMAVAELQRFKTTPFLCDPIIGDAPKGLYVDQSVAASMRDLLLPIADFATPNAFELSWLTQQPTATVEEALRAAEELPVSEVVATSVPHGSGRIANVLANTFESCVCDVPLLQSVPHGTGDLFSALLLGHLISNGKPLPDALACATAATRAIIEASLGRSELALVGNLANALAAEPAPIQPAAEASGRQPGKLTQH